MSKRTVKEVLIEKYFQFKNDIREVMTVDNEVFPVIEDEDLLEWLDTVLFLFPDVKTKYNLDQLIELKQIELEEEKRELLIPFIDKYVASLRKIKKLI